MSAYYNEYDPIAAAWLRELIRQGLIAYGVVDERSIVDVAPEDLKGFTQCHFFAGIGGWSYALRLAGWPDDKPVWTGSPPCQPFSTAGKQKGKDDERHLAPHFAALVSAGRPDILFGEQVASKDVFGPAAKGSGKAPRGKPEWAWIDDLFLRLEDAHYACGASDLPAAGVGAPHIRQRTFFGAVRLADADPTSKGMVGNGGVSLDGRETRDARAGLGRGSLHGGLADASGTRLQGRERIRAAGAEGGASGHGAECGGSGGVADADSERVCDLRRGGQTRGESGGGCAPREQRFRTDALANGGNGGATRPSPSDGQWRDADWLFCRDGKWRPVEPGTFPLADGLPSRVGRLRGYGNAIVPQAAAEFIKAFTEVMGMFK
jgi:DNA (cytosine-5)-methyltransferase 1